MSSESSEEVSAKQYRRETLSIFKELWAMGNSPLHRMYCSWEELESSIQVTQGEAKHRVQRCPYCSAEQNVTRPLDGVFPYSFCQSCKRSFFVESNLKLRKLTEEENVDIPGAWIQVVEDLAKKKVAVVFKLE